MAHSNLKLSWNSFFFLDVNECNDDLHNCHSDANCENTEGSYNCTCRPGYTGDGFNCQPEETSTTATTTTTATAAASRRRSRRRRVWGWKLDDHEWPATNIYLPSEDSCIVLCFLFLFLIVPLDALCKAFLAIFRSPNEKKKRKTWHSIRVQRPIDARGANQFLFHRREKLQFIMWIWR